MVAFKRNPADRSRRGDARDTKPPCDGMKKLREGAGRPGI
jgi:hypothetical protein